MMSDPAYTPCMSMFRTQAERRQALALVRIPRANPLLPERVEAEAEALGDAFVPSAPVWSAGEDLDNPNVERLGLLAHELAERWRQRLERHAPTPEELDVYRSVASLALYERTHPALHEELLLGDPVAKVAYWPTFLRDHQRVLQQPGAAQVPPEHLFACFYQIRRAYEAVFHGLSGGSAPAARLRGAAWQSIFGVDPDRYRRFLYAVLPGVPTLITGPTGTGKELVANAIGRSGYIPFDPDRRRFLAPPTLRAIQLSAVPSGLVESELFGHRQGAFTGATQDRSGLLDDCPPGGAVFLDEIGDLDPHVQVKLLRVLEARQFTPVGANSPRPFGGRILAATHVDLSSAIAEGRFRQDLFYRLEGDGIRVPSLRSRLDDDPGELRQIARTLLGRLVPAEVVPELLDEVCGAIDRDLGADWPWPGNVRELAQAVRRVLLHGHCTPEAQEAPGGTLRALAAEGLSMADIQRRYAQHVYDRVGSFAAAGEALGVDWRTVRSWLQSRS